MDIELVRVHVQVRGAVQGVGFRPFSYRLASMLGLNGYARNNPQGAEVEVEGPSDKVREFLLRLPRELPFPGYVAGLESAELAPCGYATFEIIRSDAIGPTRAQVLPDIAPCPRCLEEMFDPKDRRYRYPFTNCTHCGPRYTIVRSLPYDRPNTTMTGFELCPKCRAEYVTPSDRRFHAQPIACPVCGPHLELWSPDGRVVGERDDALLKACEALRRGEIVAVKGVGGFHLMVDARDDEAVRRLRQRKRREAKPLAVMAPSLDVVRELATIDVEEERLLTSPEAPIVLVPARPYVSRKLAPSIAPENPNLGLMMPPTPLHSLMAFDLGFPVVATSGNLSDEPICTDEREALQRFEGIADLLLVNNRPIERPVDDSVARVIGGQRVILRRARGLAPMPMECAGAKPGMLAVGGHLKNSVAIALEDAVVVGQHVGDLDTALARDRMAHEAADLARLYQIEPEVVACDLHPDYGSTRYADSLGLPKLLVQHHLAHVAGCLAENAVVDDALGVAWDGTGMGVDDAIWGGEFFALRGGEVSRTAHFRYFPLLGGDVAAREGRRSALGMVWRVLGEGGLEQVKAMFTEKEMNLLRASLRSNAARETSSAGRLFDAFAALGAGILRSRFEGDAAMRFENMAGDSLETYKFSLNAQNIEWDQALSELLDDHRKGVPPAVIAAKVHNGLSSVILDVAKREKLPVVALTGGCFQNRRLAEGAGRLLRENGFRVVAHQRVPPNDGGIAYGQIAAAVRGWSRTVKVS